MFIRLDDYRVIAYGGYFLIEEAVLMPMAIPMGLWVKIPIKRTCVTWRPLLLNGGMTVRFTTYGAAIEYCEELKSNPIN